MNKNLTLFLLISSIYNIVFSQVEYETAPPNHISTITFKGETDISILPIIDLGNTVQLEFDVLNGNEDDYYYTIEHFNYDWTPSTNLMRSEYIDGFDKQRIVNYENSFNTYQIYSHYVLSIPNEQVRRLKLSGNYMIKIFDESDALMFSRKFMINEGGANVGVTIKLSRDVKYFNEKHTVDLIINSSTIEFNNPLQTVKTTIIQNNNLNTAIVNVKPMYTMGSDLIYKYNKETTFWAGNEYLYFDNKEIRVANSGINFVDLQDLYNTYLYTNVVRKNLPYTYNPDINGNFVITNIDSTDPNIEADYAWINFSLKADELPINKSVYVYGNFNNYTLNERTKMTYNHEKGIYQNTMLLKQGFYNYKFVTQDESGKIDDGEISGNFYQTENNYKVVVYYRDLGGRYDKIIGVGEASSVNISN
ncbi:type IX secretion system plug protein domain-containing protein [Formosa undariae]|uniref:Type IX secretion system plug protein domain-containing protein n=1 Tax=Formosa undariae TaxID=1325436 RepID=A0ABV5F4W5_9FLAO